MSPLFSLCKASRTRAMAKRGERFNRRASCQRLGGSSCCTLLSQGTGGDSSYGSTKSTANSSTEQQKQESKNHPEPVHWHNRSMEFCKECGCDTEVAKEHGDITCTSCGLVLESRCVDDRAEWGNATSEDALWGIHPDSQLASYLSKYYGYEKISELCDRLNLSKHVEASALDFYKKLYKRKLNNGNEIPTLAACLSLSCNKHGVPRSIDEICASDNGLRRVDLVDALTRIGPLLAQEGDIIHAESSSSKPVAFINRFVSALRLDFATKKMIAAAVARCEARNTSHRPETIVASVIYLITRRSRNKKPLKDIAIVTGVKESTIKSAAKRIEDYI